MQAIQTPNGDFTLHHATPDDAALVVTYMKKLGAYQKMADQITATAPQIKDLLETKRGEAIFGTYKGEMSAFAYFCIKSSAFTGRAGLYIDGFYVDQTVRHQGLGKIVMGYLSHLALARNCQMLEWGCLDWNAPTIKFYRDLGAYSLDDMTIFRLAPDDLRSLADGFAASS